MILAIIVGVLFYFNYIQNIVASVWIAFGLGVLNMIFLVIMVLFASLNERSTLSKCLYKKGTCYLAGIIGTIVFTLISLSMDFDFYLISKVIFVGSAAFFLAFMIIQFILLMRCAIICKFCISYTEKKKDEVYFGNDTV